MACAVRRLEQCQKVVEVVTDTDDRTVHDAVKGELPALIIAGIVRRVWSQRDGNALRLELTRYNPCQFSISQDVMPEPIA